MKGKKAIIYIPAAATIIAAIIAGLFQLYSRSNTKEKKVNDLHNSSFGTFYAIEEINGNFIVNYNSEPQISASLKK